MNCGRRMAVIGRANPMGLGSMTEDFCAALDPEIVVIVDPERSQPIDLRPFKRAVVIRARDWGSNPDIVTRLLHGMTTVVGFETFYCDWIRDVLPAETKTIVFPMWECSPDSVAKSDLRICLSDRDVEYYGSDDPYNVRATWPVNEQVIALRSKPTSWPPKIFFHVAGNANGGRNGTPEVLQAAKCLAGTNATLSVFSQFPLPTSWIPDGAPVLRAGAAPTRTGLFDAGNHRRDCMVHPMQFPGLSLPMSEAAGADIPVITLDLPEWRDWPYRVPAHPVGKRAFMREADYFSANPEELGSLMRSMALGDVPYTPGPRQPTWDEFKNQWQEWMSLLGIGVGEGQ